MRTRHTSQKGIRSTATFLLVDVQSSPLPASQPMSPTDAVDGSPPTPQDLRGRDGGAPWKRLSQWD